MPTAGAEDPPSRDPRRGRPEGGGGGGGLFSAGGESPPAPQARRCWGLLLKGKRSLESWGAGWKRGGRRGGWRGCGPPPMSRACS